MKRSIFLGLILLLTSSLAGMTHASEIYWDRMPADEEISDADFKYQYGEPRDEKSFGDLGIYDNNRVINVEGPDDGVPAASQARAVPPDAPRPATVVPSTSRSAPRQTDTAPAGSNIMRRLDRTPKADTREVQREPVTTAPGSSAVTTDDAAAPADKKLKWGQVDVKPAEPKAGRFQWGDKKEP